MTGAEAMLAGLNDIGLPAEAAGGALAEAAAVLALAGILALIVGGGLRTLSLRKPSAPNLAAQVTETRALPETERRTALLTLLKTRHPDRFTDLRSQLYRPDTTLTNDHLEAELLRD